MLVTNNSTFDLANDTLVTDYGFELYYIPGSGTRELRWNRLLRENGFDKPFKWKFQRFVHVESRQKILNIKPFTVRPFVFKFVFHGGWYGVGFDGQSITIQNNHGNESLESYIL